MTTLPPRRVTAMRANDRIAENPLKAAHPKEQSLGARTLKRRDRQPGSETGAGDESRTRDLNLGKVALYQLSYSRARERL